MNLLKELKLTWLSPETIRKISFGEITNHGMLDTKTLKPKLGGLFDPKIFGPYNSWECYCGKYKGKQFSDIKCERCEVLVTNKNIQRWRMGHVELAVPITNVLFFKNLSNVISKMLEITTGELEEIIYCNSYVVISPGKSKLVKEKDIFVKLIKPELIEGFLEELINSISDSNDNEEKKNEEVDLILNENENSEKEENKSEKVLKKAKLLLKNLKKNKEGSIFFWEDYLPFLEKTQKIRIETGSQAFLELIEKIDLKKEFSSLKENKKKRGKAEQEKIARFIFGLKKNKLNLSWIILKNLLVMPSGLRPITKLKKEETVSKKEIFATTQINTLYRKIILANENVKYYTSAEEKSYFGEVIINNAKRRLQKAVDNLFQGSIQKSGETKGLIQQLSGKEGILRHYSLGKRTDFSGRAVITTSPDISFKEIKIPVQIAITTFKPLIIRNLLEKKITFTIKESEDLINRELTGEVDETNKGIVFQQLNKICSEHLVLFNRAPSLHRLSMQAAYPRLTLSKTIDIHPLITTPYNADFDGDMLLILNLLTKEELLEAEERMLTTTQIIDPKNGNVITILKQDIILGLYYLTNEKKPEKISFFTDLESLFQENELGNIHVQDLIVVPSVILKREKLLLEDKKNHFVITTLGKIIFNQTLPESFPFYINELPSYNREEDYYQIETYSSFSETNKKLDSWEISSGWEKIDLVPFVDKVVKQFSPKRSADFLDDLKDLGFKYASISGISISPFEIGEIISKEEKEKIVNKTNEEINALEKYYQQGFLSIREWKEKKRTIWQKCKDDLKDLSLARFKEKKTSSLYSIWESGARISSENLSQLFAMRGHVTDFRGETIETPIISSLWEGLTPFETFILTFGMVKGLIDKTLRTSDSGYLARRLVEAIQESIVVIPSCETKEFVTIEEESFEVLNKQINSRVLARDIFGENQEETLIQAGTLIGREELKIIRSNQILSVSFFSPLTCSAERGICQRCYGGDLSKIKTLISLGSAVGIIAAHSLGEPGTQLTLRTFHSGGIVVGEDIVQQGLPKVQQIFDNTKPKIKATLAKKDGIITEVTDGYIRLEFKEKEKIKEIDFPYDNKIRKAIVTKGQTILKGERLTTGIIDLEEYLELAEHEKCMNYIVKEIKSVYTDQGIEVHNKHIEMFARGMLSRVEIIDGSNEDPEEESYYVSGDIVKYETIRILNQELEKKKKKLIKFKFLISSLKSLASSSSSFLASAAFQSPLKTLVNYSIHNPNDFLENPKTSLIIGQLPPVGEGFIELEKYKQNLKERKIRHQRENEEEQ